MSLPNTFDSGLSLCSLSAAVLSLAFALFVSIGGPHLKGRQSAWLHWGFALTFFAMAVAVIGTLMTLYADGAQAKTRALADSLGQRLSDIVAFNININDIQGLDVTFGEYQVLNPDISAAALTIDGVVQIHTNPAMVWQTLVTR